MSLRPAVFLDRDGVLIEEVAYLSSTRQLRLLPRVPAALRRLLDAGFVLVAVSNQSDIARGFTTERALAELHARLDALLHAGGAGIDAWLHCPHHPEGAVARFRRICDCRKPGPGLLHRAVELLGVDLARSYLVGDRRSDVEAGRRAGCTTLLVQTGHGESELARPPRSPLERPHAVAEELAAAVEWILHEQSQRRTRCEGRAPTGGRGIVPPSEERA